ncbi:hypothetical protein DM01DRAFT_1371910 [Hesseltinella vesiculosa]|uniref:Uncharacterized protein n=1 Tax=Hesseltinella vesiculosa TaxID=101127 RepID=A0A1X2GQ20_9FUNG|nr:hypothetical protein DM01DRAFT_1371910 [Hesseltinella vesiculosa]
MTEPHPRLIQRTLLPQMLYDLPSVPIASANGIYPSLKDVDAAMIQWNDLTKDYSQISNNVVLPLNIYLPDDLASMPEDYIIRQMISNPSKRSAIAFYASCINSSGFLQQIPERTLQRLHDRMTIYDCNGRLIGFVDVRQHWIHLHLAPRRQPPPPRNIDSPPC